MHASDLIQHEDTSGTTRETSHQCCIMRKAKSKKVGAGGRFDIFLDSGRSCTGHTRGLALSIEIKSSTSLGSCRI